jgi:hypothetical protein
MVCEVSTRVLSSNLWHFYILVFWWSNKSFIPFKFNSYFSKHACYVFDVHHFFKNTQSIFLTQKWECSIDHCFVLVFLVVICLPCMSKFLYLFSCIGLLKIWDGLAQEWKKLLVATYSCPLLLVFSITYCDAWTGFSKDVFIICMDNSSA